MYLFKFLFFCVIASNIYLSQSVTVRLDDRYIVSFELSENDTVITFEITAQTTGYVGFGLSTNGKMAGSDIVVAGVRNNGFPYLEDRHAIANSMPLMDEQQDYTLITAGENSTHTYVKFSRLVLTCDEDDLPITADSLRMIWSLGETDTLSYHNTNRGAKSVYLLDPEMPDPDMSQFMSWDIVTNATMPSNSTTYYCTIHKTPTLTRSHHMVAFDVVLSSPEAFQHTHHIDIYTCTAPDGVDPDDLFGPYLGHSGVDCYYPHDPDFPVRQCKLYTFGWSIGAGINTFPENVGLPMESNQYYVLEIHYDNPNRLEAVQFTTGLRWYYTDQLRDITGSQFFVSSIINITQMIPPNSVDYVNVAHCSPDCTNSIPPEGINVFNIQLHSHFSGRKMKVRHWRGGIELPFVVTDDNYDFNYQSHKPLKEHYKFLPGDQISVECTYDTTWRNGLSVIGGRATSEEMCIAFFFYYPRLPNFITCNSEMRASELLGFFGIEQVHQEPSEEDATVALPLSMSGRKFTEVVESFNWTQEMRDLYQHKHRFEPQDGYCYPVGTRFEATYPDIEPYVPPELRAKV